MKITRFAVLAMSSIALVASPGCKRKAPVENAAATADPSAPESYQEVPPSPLHDLYIAVDEKLEAGDKEGATAMILAAMDDAKFADHKSELFTTIVRYLLFTEQVDEAKTRFLNMIRTEPELAQPGFDLIYGHYVQQGDAAATLAWVRELMLQPLVPEMKRPAYEWLLVGLLDAGEAEELVAKLPGFAEEFPVDDVAQVSQRLCASARQAEKYDLLDQLVGVLAASGKAREPAMANVILSSRLLGLAGRGDWAGVVAAFPPAMETLPDADLQSLLANVAGTARKAGKADVVESLAETLLKSPAVEGKAGTRNVAAREWVNAAVTLGHPTLVPERLAALIAFKIPPKQVYSNLSRHFYELANDPATVKAMLVQAEVLSPLLEEDSSRNALNALMLDGAFLVEDYTRALTLLEKGIADRDEAWHTMAKTKVLAHKALQDKDVDGAVKQFRAFMEIIAKSEEDSPDPVSNIVHTRGMILGRNAKRIGEIYRDAGRADEAAKAFAEAKDLYAKALADNKAGEETEKLIREEMAALPADPVAAQ